MSREDGIRTIIGGAVGAATNLVDQISSILDNPLGSTIILTLTGATISYIWPVILEKIFKLKTKKEENV